MAHEISQISYIGYGNAVCLDLEDDSSGTMKASDLSGVTRMELVGGGVSLNSEDHPDVFDWSEGGGRVSLALGEMLEPGQHMLYLAVFDAIETDGIVWDTALNIESIKLT